MTPLCIAYVTCRPEPHLEWFIRSLAAQTTPEQQSQIELLIVDGHLWRHEVGVKWAGFSAVPFTDPGMHDLSRREKLDAAIDGRFPNTRYLPPKPNAYQGPWRQTKRDMFCAASTRNSVFVVAKSQYVMFADDLSWAAPTWFSQVLHAAEHGYLLAGMYRKCTGLKVSTDGRVTYDSIASTDSRWDHGSESGIVPWHGSGIYGCSFGVPLEAALEVDGNDCACDAGGAEDCDLGTRLERAGWPVFLNKNCLTLENEELHHDGSKLPQNRYLVARENLPICYDTYTHARPDEKYWSDHVLLNRLNNERDRTLPLIGSDLRKLRAEYQKTGLVPVPPLGMLDWRTGRPVSEL